LDHGQQGAKGAVDDVEDLPLQAPRSLEGLGDQRGVRGRYWRDGGLGDHVDIDQQLLGDIVPEQQQNDSGCSETAPGRGTLLLERSPEWEMWISSHKFIWSGHGQDVW